MNPWSLEFARMVYTAACAESRGEMAAFRKLMDAVDAAKRARKK